jgi:hypothetical protein
MLSTPASTVRNGSSRFEEGARDVEAASVTANSNANCKVFHLTAWRCLDEANPARSRARLSS